MGKSQDRLEDVGFKTYSLARPHTCRVPSHYRAKSVNVSPISSQRICSAGTERSAALQVQINTFVSIRLLRSDQEKQGQPEIKSGYHGTAASSFSVAILVAFGLPKGQTNHWTTEVCLSQCDIGARERRGG
jgi:hypothetical protein